MGLMPVAEALARILDGVRPLTAEAVPLAAADGRILARPLKARRDQPPFPASAMDGYAVRAADVATVPATLRVIGIAPAGHGFSGTVKPGQAVRIFTGAPVPRGADAVIMQENTTAGDGTVTVLHGEPAGRSIRRRGLDFARGETVIVAGTRLGPRTVGLAAALNHAEVHVARRPTVAILATGDELVAPGTRPRADQIVGSNSFALAALVRRLGAEPVDLGLVPDRLADIERAVAAAAGADILVTIGGASVGDHDLVQAGLAGQGIGLDFWKIAMRPGKPLMFARRQRQRILGLPGNPVSALVCSLIFLRPLIAALTGETVPEGPRHARLGAALKANDQRQDYMRSSLGGDGRGGLVATPIPVQDSSMQRVFADAGCLIVRPPFAPALVEGATVEILPLDI